MIRRTILALPLLLPAETALAQFDSLTLKPIVKAVREGDDEKVRQSLLKGDNPNQTDTNGQPLLMVAVMAGQIAVVETLLKGGAVVDATDRDGYTSLLRAAEKGDVDIVDILLKRNAKPGLVFHTDRGSTYTAHAFTKLCRQLGIRQSMGRVGSCFDNAAAEAFFSSLEWEVLSRNRFRDTIHAQAVVIDWCYTFYNHQRRHSAADGLSDRKSVV